MAREASRIRHGRFDRRFRAALFLAVLVSVGSFPVAPTTASEPSVTPTENALSVRQHACALTADGRVKCWGADWSGQLGDGTPSEPMIDNSPDYVIGVSRAVAVAVGASHSCALLASGMVQCWGDGRDHQLGDGLTQTRSGPPATVKNLNDAIAISAGSFHNCALRATGTVVCWGNRVVFLGDGTLADAPTPVEVPGVTGAVDVSAGGGGASCAVLSDGRAKCWGSNYYGVIGDGTNIDRPEPVAVSGITTAVEIEASGVNTCALLADGTVRCWGQNQNGELGNGTGMPSNVPVQIAGIENATNLSGPGATKCVRLQDATAKCWGDNSTGALGDGGWTSQYEPVAVVNLTDVVTIAAGVQRSCALVQGGTVKCWGQWVLSPRSVAGFERGVGGIGNDAIQFAQAVTGVPFVETVSLADATTQSGEPEPSCAGPAQLGRSVWYTYKPSFPHVLRYSAQLNAVLAVYTGSSIEALTEHACLAEAASGELAVDAGTTYHLQLTGPGSGEPGFSLAGDTTPPLDPTLSSPTHALNTWSNERSITFAWSGASDAESGVDGYAMLWDHDPATTPEPTISVHEVYDHWRAHLDDGVWYFHLRTRDNVGNWSDGVHLGPFWIDGTSPSTPGNVRSTSHVVGQRSSDNTVSVAWSSALDTGGSGLAGYSFTWDEYQNTIPDEAIDAGPAATSTVSPALKSPGWFHFHVRARDAVGSWGPTVHLGPFLIDTTPPDLPDSMLRLSADALFVGNNVYNDDGAGQAKSASARRGKSKTFVVRVQNDGTSADRFTISGPGSSANFKLKYLLGPSGTTDITAKVVAGTYVTKSTAPGGTRTIRVVIKARSGAPIGAAIRCVVRTTSRIDTTSAVDRDVVVSTLTVR